MFSGEVNFSKGSVTVCDILSPQIY